MYVPSSPWAFGGLYRHLRDLYDIRPSEKNFHWQKMMGGLAPPYKTYMEGKTYDALAAENRDKLGVGWSDIKYPWAASLAGGNTHQAVGSAISQVSRSLYSMYPDGEEEGPRRGQSYKAWKKERDWARRRYR